MKISNLTRMPLRYRKGILCGYHIAAEA